MTNKHMKRCSISYVIRKFKLKRGNTTHLLEWYKSRTLTIPNVGENVEQQEFSFIGSGNAKWYSILEDNLGASYKTKHTHTTWSSNRAPWYLHRVENLCLYKNYTRLFIAALVIIAKTWKQWRGPSVGEWINNLCYLQTMEYYSALKEMSYQAIKKHGGNLTAYY